MKSNQPYWDIDFFIEILKKFLHDVKSDNSRRKVVFEHSGWCDVCNEPYLACSVRPHQKHLPHPHDPRDEGVRGVFCGLT